MGCGHSEMVNPAEIDITHFEVYNTVGQGGFGKVNAVCRKGPLAKAAEEKGKLYALKRMAKEKIITHQTYIDMVWVERRILAKIGKGKSRFLVPLLHAFQTDVELLLVMPFFTGGDLRFQLNERKGRCMPEEMTQFYTAQILLGLHHLHSLNIVYRDMKPENALLSADGNLVLSDFGISCELSPSKNFLTKGRCGTFGYQAPEMLARKPYSFTVDYWSLGVCVYEFLHGDMPFKSSVEQKDAISQEYIDKNLSRPKISSSISKPARELIKGLLETDPKKRLGCGADGWLEVKRLDFFKGVDWDKMEAFKLTPPIKPSEDKANNTGIAAANDILIDEKPKKVAAEKDALFKEWEWGVEVPKEEGPEGTSLRRSPGS